MKTFIRSTILTSIAILFLLGGTTAAFANSNQQQMQTQPLSLNVPIGGVTNLGTQVYTVSGGQVAYAEVGGNALNPGASLQYNFVATQNGMNTKGYASISLSGTTSVGGANVPISMSSRFTINGAVPGAVIGQSELPFVFTTSTSNVQVTVAGSTQTIPESLNIESPYFNPWGGPIVMGSTDQAIVIVATYTQGTILWAGTQVTGPMTGTLGTSTSVAGTLSLTSGELENLVAGTAFDAGTITFSGMTPASLNVNGVYTGSDTIPYPVGTSGYQIGPQGVPTGTPAPWDCSPYFGIPGTCTETGFQSMGKFKAQSMSGTYVTSWAVPAVYFTSTITATVLQPATPNGLNGRLNSQGTLCTSNGGTWVGQTDTCTIPAGTTWTIAAGNTLFISSGVTLVNYGTIVNLGSVLNSGTITNNGVVTNNGTTFYNGNSGPTGAFNNNGIFTNNAGYTFDNFAGFTNSANATVNNYGTYQHHTGGSMNNAGSFFNYGTTDSHTNTFNNFGNFANMGSGNVANSSGATLTNECGGQIPNVPNNEFTQASACSQ